MINQYRIKLNKNTYNSFIGVCAVTKQFTHAERLFEEMINNELFDEISFRTMFKAKI